MAQSLRTFFAARVRSGEITNWRTRFAPAPTGYLHLGHVVNALHVWGIARAYGGEVLLRLEDHDRTRCRAEYELALLNDLDWLGFIPDRATTNEFRAGASPLRQSDNLTAYQAVLDSLAARGALYACQCSRRDIASLAPIETGAETRYPGTCAALSLNDAAPHAVRMRVTNDIEHFGDLRLGMQSQCPDVQCGDFVLRDRNGNFTYQFAVTVDDWQQDIAVIIRGEDLLPSTGRQLQLARVIGRKLAPVFLHHQLILRDDGIKLSKSLGDTGVREMRAARLSSRDVLGRAAFASGLIAQEIPLAIDDLKYLFD
ncbi:MAG: tRNA glutamyl-Q(34) synthetase GluQRS [Phycisphaerae bacterium]|nr:tRNA glutamyl-Q(34) synthetase GluQRS [Gemmatimonadaceae bacterium]